MGDLAKINDMVVADTLPVGELVGLSASQRGYLSMYLDLEDGRRDVEKERLSGVSKAELNAMWGNAEVNLYVEKVLNGAIKGREYPGVIRWCKRIMGDEDVKQQKF